MPVFRPLPADAHLGWIVAGAEANSHDIGFMDQTLSEEEWQEFQNICHILPQLRPRIVDFISAEKEAHALFNSPTEFSEELRNVSHPMLIGGLHATLGLAHIQTALTNYLGAASALIYRAERYISKNFGGKKSAQFEDFKALQTQEYDSVFAYRLFRNMRNYAQHSELPISFMQLSGEMHEGKMIYVTDKIGFERNELLQALMEEKAQKTFRQELAASTETFYSMVELAAADLKSLGRLFNRLCSYHASQISDMAHYAAAVHRIIERQGFPNATPVIFAGRPIPGTQAKPHLFSFDEMNYLATLLVRTV
jgi:hypothetical protein